MQVSILIGDRQIGNEIEQFFRAHRGHTFFAEKYCNIITIHAQELQSMWVIVLYRLGNVDNVAFAFVVSVNSKYDSLIYVLHLQNIIFRQISMN